MNLIIFFQGNIYFTFFFSADNLNCSYLSSNLTLFEDCSEEDRINATCDSKSFFINLKFLLPTPKLKYNNTVEEHQGLFGAFHKVFKGNDCSCLNLWILLIIVMLESTLLSVQCVTFIWRRKRKITAFLSCRSCRKKNDGLQILEYEMYN